MTLTPQDVAQVRTLRDAVPGPEPTRVELSHGIRVLLSVDSETPIRCLSASRRGRFPEALFRQVADLAGFEGKPVSKNSASGVWYAFKRAEDDQ